MNERPHLLLDCDPGIDDAFALFCALKYANLDAITTVSGNVSINNTTRNARYLMDLANADVPIHRGAAAPLQLPAMAADDIHGPSGFGSTATPEVSLGESEIGAVDAILNYCADGDATVVATGPLTNIALALQRDPSLSERIDHLYWMGGGTDGGNVTAHAEFNAWGDPHAADVVFKSGTVLTMYDLHLTHQVRMDQDHVAILGEAGTASSTKFAEVLDFYRVHGEEHLDGQPIHDPCALLGVTHPDLFTIETGLISCHANDGELRGKTEVTPSPDGPHRVAITAQADEVIDLIVAAAIDPSPEG